MRHSLIVMVMVVVMLGVACKGKDTPKQLTTEQKAVLLYKYQKAMTLQVQLNQAAQSFNESRVQFLKEDELPADTVVAPDLSNDTVNITPPVHPTVSVSPPLENKNEGKKKP